MKLTIIGSGYVGLVAGACFADAGHTVVCVDKNERKVAGLKRGVIPIYEPGLAEMVAQNVSLGRLSFTTDLEVALEGAAAAFIAVGTPPRIGDGHADLRFVFEAAREIAACASGDLVVVDKSTVPVGTGDEVERLLRETNSPHRFSVVSNPEFLREGVAIEDFRKPDRIIIGGDDKWGMHVVREIYAAESFEGTRIVQTSRRSAELIKYASNAFLAMKVTYINEICDLCEAIGADIRDVSLGMGLDSRIGEKFLNAGPGYGGSCFPKDTVAITKTARDYRVQLRTIETVIQVNEYRKRSMVNKVIDAVGGSIRGRSIAVLGLTFKANTDDMRESPAISIVQALQDFGASVRVYDPQGMENSKQVLRDVAFCGDGYEAATGADAAVIVTEWPEFREIELAELKQRLRRPVIVDLRNIFSEKEALDAGLDYWGLGTNDRHEETPQEMLAAE